MCGHSKKRQTVGTGMIWYTYGWYMFMFYKIIPMVYKIISLYVYEIWDCLDVI